MSDDDCGRVVDLTVIEDVLLLVESAVGFLEWLPMTTDLITYDCLLGEMLGFINLLLLVDWWDTVWTPPLKWLVILL